MQFNYFYRKTSCWRKWTLDIRMLLVRSLAIFFQKLLLVRGFRPLAAGFRVYDSVRTRDNRSSLTDFFHFKSRCVEAVSVVSGSILRQRSFTSTWLFFCSARIILPRLDFLSVLRRKFNIFVPLKKNQVFENLNWRKKNLKTFLPLWTFLERKSGLLIKFGTFN